MGKPSHRVSILFLWSATAIFGCAAPKQAASPTRTETNGLVMVAIPGTNGWTVEVKPCPLLTNRFFINKGESWTFEGPSGIWVNPEKIREAQQARECQPAEEDPGGNWGTARGGYQLSLRLEKQIFALGEAINTTVIFRNVSNQDQNLPGPVGIPRFDTELVLTKEKGEPVRSVEEEALEGLSSFERRLRKIVSSPKWSIIVPRTQVKEQARIDQLFRLSAPQTYRVQVRYRAHVGTEVVTVSSGTASFKVVDK